MVVVSSCCVAVSMPGLFFCRLMVSKMSELPVVAEHLKQIMESINDKLRQRWCTSCSSSNSEQGSGIPKPVISVGISSAT